MRERGPLEYDKFALNIFQIVNMANHHLDVMKSGFKITEEDTVLTQLNNLYQDFLVIYNYVIDISTKLYLDEPFDTSVLGDAILGIMTLGK